MQRVFLRWGFAPDPKKSLRLCTSAREKYGWRTAATGRGPPNYSATLEAHGRDERGSPETAESICSLV